ncbi:MAG: protein kinase domain-containing protein [Bacillota bacterium]
MQVGDFFNGRYIIEKVLGQGGMGTVYLARNINTDTYWAIKEIPATDANGIDLTAEPRMLKKLEHPALPRLFDIIEQDGCLYMISDYISGTPLDKKLKEEGKISEEIVVDWGIQLCQALNYLHSQKPNPIIYRDMKPSNIILTAGGTLKLVDFGIAREYKPKSGSDTVYIGTRGYAAPEQFGTGQTSPASDIFSLGVTLHELLTGKDPSAHPFDLKPVRFYNDSVSAGLEKIISKCTAEDVHARYQSAADLLADLEALQYKPGIKTGSPGIFDDNAPVMHDGVGGEGALAGIRAFSRKKRFGFRKLVITVWDNAEFGCELAYAAAKFTGAEVLLADLDLLAPKADLFLNLKRFASKPLQPSIFGHSALGVVMDAISKGMLTSDLLKQSTSRRKDLKNLHVITGSLRLDYYEYYAEDSVPKLIDKCYRNYDITILLVNRFIYDAFTLASLLKSDINIIATRGDVDQLREFNTYIDFLKEKQNLPPENTMFVLYEYDKSTGMSIDEIREATRNSLLGRISPSRRRAAYRNKRSSYVSHMEKFICDEYVRLLARLDLMPSPGMLEKFGLFMAKISEKARMLRRKTVEG